MTVEIKKTFLNEIRVELNSLGFNLWILSSKVWTAALPFLPSIFHVNGLLTADSSRESTLLPGHLRYHERGGGSKWPHGISSIVHLCQGWTPTPITSVISRLVLNTQAKLPGRDLFVCSSIPQALWDSADRPSPWTYSSPVAYSVCI